MIGLHFSLKALKPYFWQSHKAFKTFDCSCFVTVTIEFKVSLHLEMSFKIADQSCYQDGF